MRHTGTSALRAERMSGAGCQELIEQNCRSLGSQAEFARCAGVSRAFISQMLRGVSEPGDRVLRYLGLEKRIIYHKVKRGRK